MNNSSKEDNENIKDIEKRYNEFKSTITNRYICKRCGFNTDIKSSIKTHIMKPYKCKLIFFDISKDELLDLTIKIANLVRSFGKEINIAIFESNIFSYLGHGSIAEIFNIIPMLVKNIYYNEQYSYNLNIRAIKLNEINNYNKVEIDDNYKLKITKTNDIPEKNDNVTIQIFIKNEWINVNTDNILSILIILMLLRMNDYFKMILNCELSECKFNRCKKVYNNTFIKIYSVICEKDDDIIDDDIVKNINDEFEYCKLHLLKIIINSSKELYGEEGEQRIYVNKLYTSDDITKITNDDIVNGDYYKNKLNIKNNFEITKLI